MEQQVSEIHKGLTGYNYGQRTDLPYGRNLDPNYVGTIPARVFCLMTVPVNVW